MRRGRHPWHPAFVHLPIGLLTASLAWDAVGLWAAGGIWPALAYWCLLGGLVMAVPAVATGFVEYLFLEDGRAVSLANWHMSAMSAAAGLFLASLLLRGDPGTAAPWPALACSAGGLLVMLAGGWLAAEMVYREGAGFRGSAEKQ